MGKVEFFTISLQKTEAIYFPGEPVIGSVSFRITERLKINAIKMVVNGEARVRWTEGSGKNSRTYSSSKSYMKHSIMFVVKEENNDLFLEVGDYTYPFTVNLPLNLPTSFEHIYGKMRYSLNATIDIPWAIDKHSTKSFTVVSILDLNAIREQNLRKSVEITDTKVLCCGPCKSNPIMAEFTAKKTGYVPGETIVCNASIDNRTNKIIKPMKAKLIQLMIFKASSKTKTCSRDVATIEHTSSVASNSHEDWNNIKLLIPPVCSSTINPELIIEIKYELVLNFDASGSHVSKSLRIPIVIGTIPLTEADIGTPPSYGLLSYQASVFDPESGSIAETNSIKGDVLESDSKTFKPYYPYYETNQNSIKK